jgi:putative protease
MHSSGSSPCPKPERAPDASPSALRAPPAALPELLAPAGDWDCAKAAVENGADAIYFGLEKFNARMRADNFTEADLPELMEFLHRRGVKGYVTFNTLVFENEMAQAEQYARTFIAAGVDAAIVQDAGICRLIRRLSPVFPIHVSTQMTVTSAGGIEFARKLGCNLVVLARECSLKEIEKIQACQIERCQQSTIRGSPSASAPLDNHSLSTVSLPLPLEVFIHGALCVAYSGQCLTSEALGGRSANRGECAQACRMPYDLIADGKPVPLGDRKYLLSPQDLAGLEVLPELVRLGVASLKIEGRLKSAEYVANITRIYRLALDKLNQFDSTSARYEMEMAFSRGLYTGWFQGTNNQKLVHAHFGKKRGVYLGQVAEVRRQGVLIQLEGPLKPGDGVVFDAGRPEEKEEGGRVYEIRNPKAEKRTPMAFGGSPTRYAGATERRKSEGPDSRLVELRFGGGDIDFRRLHAGDKLWKTSDPELERRLRQSFAGDKPRFQQPISVEAHGLAGKPLTLVARDKLGHLVRLDSAMPLVHAEKQPLTTERLQDQLGRMGGTPFKLGEFKNLLEGDVLLPVSELNRLRRQLVEELELQRAQPPRWTLECGARSAERGMEVDSAPAGIPHSALRTPRLIVLVRNLPQLEAALDSGIETLYCEFEDPKKYRDAVQRVRATRAHLLDTESSSEGCEHRTVQNFQHPLPPHPSPLPQGEGSPLAALRAARGDRSFGSRGAILPLPRGEGRGEGEGTAHRSDAFGHRDPPSNAEIFVAPPRIFKMGEEWTLKQVRSCEADGYLVRNYDHLAFFANDRRVGDYSLNIANRLAAEYFKGEFGLERITASYDLNFSQLEALLAAAPPEWFEVTLHQHMPMFHMEHCIFCAFLSNGTDYTNCGRPCDQHDLKLRDRVGAEHPVKADVGCRNTVFNSLAQTGAEYVPKMLALGVRHFRLEFLNETPVQVAQTIGKYRQLLRGEVTGADVWRELRLFNQLGVTRGQICG